MTSNPKLKFPCPPDDPGLEPGHYLVMDGNEPRCATLLDSGRWFALPPGTQIYGQLILKAEADKAALAMIVDAVCDTTPVAEALRRENERLREGLGRLVRKIRSSRTGSIGSIDNHFLPQLSKSLMDELAALLREEETKDE